MAKKQPYIALEATKRGTGIVVDIGLDTGAWSRKEALASFQKRCEMKPDIVLNEKEANDLLDRLQTMLRPQKWTKKLENEFARKLQAAEAKGRSKRA